MNTVSLVFTANPFAQMMFQLTYLRHLDKFGNDKKGVDSWTEQKDTLFEKYQREMLSNQLPEVSAKILDLAAQHGRVTVAFLEKSLQMNRNTIKKHLQQLCICKKKELILQGKGRGVYYTLQ